MTATHWLIAGFLDWRYGPSIDPSTHDTFKFFPHNPPRKGEKVLIDHRRCVVTRVKVSWEGREWTLLDLRVREIA